MKNRNKLKGLQKRKAISGYLFISPFIIGFLVFMIRPLFQSFYMSLCRVDMGPEGLKNNFIGLQNYKQAFTVDIDFNRMLTTELKDMAIKTLAIMVFSFLVALILNQKFRGRAVVRAIFFLPVILSSGVILGIEYDNSLLSSLQDTIKKSNEFANVNDVIEDVLNALDIGRGLMNTIYTLIDNVYDIAISSGIQIIIFLSGLQTIPQSMYEAADIEGCTSWEKLWKITFPMISPLFLVNWVYTIVDFFMRSDNDVMDKIKTTMVVKLDYGFASAMAWVYFGIVIVIIGVTSYIISKAVYYYE
ncbi:MAG: carbohydrate ABC transporter permease [Lachnospiraceae bacterium]